MRLSISLLGLALVCASPSLAGTTGNGGAQVRHEESRCRDMGHGSIKCDWDEDRPPPGVTAQCRDFSYSTLHHQNGGVLRLIR
jgi:hypothetical protein